ncbi:MAG: hypothetical protein HZA35_00060 [Parcubacteria group bacterium]|nr:hypothetical protein [Parcubacteria group bacterium]
MEGKEIFSPCDAVKCLIGIHCVPSNWCFETHGALFEGGVCPCCGALKQGKFLGNVWKEEARDGGDLCVMKRFDVISWAKEHGYELKGSF